MDQSVKDQRLARELNNKGFRVDHKLGGDWELDHGGEIMEGYPGENLEQLYARWMREEHAGTLDGEPINSRNFDEMQKRLRQRKWDLRWLSRAKEISRFSKDPSTKVGAVIVDSVSQRVVSEGYNGFPRRIYDTPENLNDRERKYPRVVHGEMNAIIGLVGNPLALHSSLTLYTWPPGFGGPTCDNCAKHVISVSGIQRVVWAGAPLDERAGRWGNSIQVALEMYREAGVELVEVPEDACRAAGLFA